MKGSRHLRANRARCIDQGLCIDCGLEKVGSSTSMVRCSSCRAKINQWKKDNREHVKNYSQEWKIRNKEHIRCFARERMRNMRIEVLTAYGSKCVQCGEDRLPCLEIDHINNDGAQHRKQLKINGGSNALTQWLWRMKCPPGFQLLCGNCHRMKHYRRFQ